MDKDVSEIPRTLWTDDRYDHEELWHWMANQVGVSYKENEEINQVFKEKIKNKIYEKVMNNNA